MSSTVTSARRRRLMLAFTIGGLLTFAAWVPALAVETGSEPEGCPGTTTLVAQFDHGAGGWTASGSSSGITVTGDSSTAYWTAASAVTAVVISAGSVTQNFVYDPPETTGQISSSDVEDAAGGALAAIGFCQGGGAVPNPSSGSPISIDLTKSADCATLNADGTYTVAGTITVTRHSPPDNPPQVPMRVTVARDVVLAPGDVALQRTTVTTLEGALLPAGTASITHPYSVTFNAMGATALTNKVEVMVEESVSGLDRHKFYSARVGFELCAIVPPTPTQPQPPAATSTPAGAVLGSTPTPRSAPLPNTATETASFAGVSGLVLLTAAVLLVSLRVLAGTNLARLRHRRDRT